VRCQCRKPAIHSQSSFLLDLQKLSARKSN